MKLTILTPFFPPETGAPQSRLYEMSKRLKQYGHDVQILTALPNAPVGKIFPGYRWRLWHRETIDGISVVRTWMWAVKSKSSVLRLLSIVSWLFTALFIGFWFCRRPQLLLWNSPPLFSAPVANFLKRIWRVPLVMWVADVWPITYIRLGNDPNSMGVKLLAYLERKSYKQADLIALVTPGAQEDVEERFPNVTTTIWSNGVDTELFQPGHANPKQREAYGLTKDHFTVVFAGLHGMFQGMDVFTEAAKELQSEPNVRLLLVGDGVRKPELLETAKRENLTNLIFGDPIPKSEVPALIASCEVSAVPLCSRMPGTMPSKFYEALASGVPAVVAAECEAQRLIDKYEVGFTYEPGDGKSFAEAVRKLSRLSPEEFDAMRRRCRELSARFERDRLAKSAHETLVALEQNQPLPKISW